MVRVKFIFIQFCLLITVTNFAQQLPVTPQKDTILTSTNDDSFLNNKVKYDAKDSMRIDMVNQKAYLYNNAHVTYEDIKLQAGYIEIDFGKDLVYATSCKDSVGKDLMLKC